MELSIKLSLVIDHIFDVSINLLRDILVFIFSSSQ